MTSGWASVPRLLAQHDYLVLGTADAEGRPWVTPVFYAARDDHCIFWVSAPDSRHSRNIAHRSTIAITIFDSHAPIGAAEALYLEASATPVHDHDRHTAVDILNSRLPVGRQLATCDLVPPGPLRVYRADVTQHFVLVRGGDKQFDNVTDMRLAVAPAEPNRR